jgi:membrane peptidoglycan carboxypeptidase
MNPPRRKIPSFRDGLIRIHADLFTIERKVLLYEGASTLSRFEKLVLVLEDRRFLNHDGFDVIACGRELFKALTWRKHGGASTIDMQFVRTATGFKDRTIRRKLYEILLAVIIQFRYSKLQIIRSYLACAFFGSRLIGINKAIQEIYGRPINELSELECAELAAMLVYPKPLRPKEGWNVKIRQRANYGLRRMTRLEKSLEKIPSRK